jgi:phage tail sheath protein FI
VPTYQTPGVYVEEIATLPPSVAEVATAVPAFIGYTKVGPAASTSPVVTRLSTMLEFETAFGGALPAAFTVALPVDAQSNPTGTPTVTRDATASTSRFSLYYALSLYFRNGGGPCYVVSVGNYQAQPAKQAFLDGLTALAREDEPTLIVLTDAACVLSAADYYEVCGQALAQCASLGDRFVILDVASGDVAPAGGVVKQLRDNTNLSANLMYGAAYHPYLQTSLGFAYDETSVSVTAGAATPPVTPKVSAKLALGDGNGISVSYSGPAGGKPNAAVVTGTAGAAPTFATSTDLVLTITAPATMIGTDLVTAWTAWKKDHDSRGFDIAASGTGASVTPATASTPLTIAPPVSSPASSQALSSFKSTATAVYNQAKAALDSQRVVLPPSAAVAGIYARVDREQGVWKAPANVGVLSVLGPVTKINDEDQKGLNVEPNSGKSINAIRAFVGKGTLVWGARTLLGNDNEWRYVSVRRLFITIEESTRKASAFAVFEANDQSTWLKVKAMIESYLYGLWEQGALQGAKPEDAYYVHVGLGTTMTPQDVLEGRLIVAIGVAAVRPAEFIVIRFSHKLQTA